jgi:hypothetical protein
VGLKTLPPTCADCLEIWYPQRLFRAVTGFLYLSRESYSFRKFLVDA